MFQTRTSVRLLNYLGIALVALPEPFTTPFGVALLFAARHLSQDLELALDNPPPEAYAYRSYWFKHPRDYANRDPAYAEELKRYPQNEPRPIPGQYGLPGASSYQSYWFKRPGDYADSQSSAPEKIEQHPTPHQYGLPGASAYQSYWFKRADVEASPSVGQTRHHRRDRGQEAAPPIGEPVFLPRDLK
jgi:hypothetical protein